MRQNSLYNPFKRLLIDGNELSFCQSNLEYENY